MKDLVNLHLNYLINKITLFVFVIIIIISLISNISSLDITNDNVSITSFNEQFFSSSFFITKMLGVFLSIFLFSYNNISSNDQYSYLILTSNISRSIYLISKIISIIFIILLFIILETFMFCVVGFFGYNNFLTIYIYNFIYLFFLLIFYGLISLFVTKIIDNVYGIVFPFTLFNIGLIINQNNNKFTHIYNFIFPSFKENGYTNNVSLIHIFFLCIVLIFVIIFLNNKIDWK